jgi:glutaredoxin
VEVQLVVADWCPQCRGAKTIWRMLSLEAGTAYEEVDIGSARGQELAARFQIKAVPSVIVNDTLCPGASRDVEEGRAVLRKTMSDGARPEAP